MKNILNVLLVFVLSLFGCSSNENELIQNEEETVITEFTVLEDIYVEDASFKVVGYLPTYRLGLIDKIDFRKLTYLNFIAANPSSTGEILYANEAELENIIKFAKQQNPNLKIIMSLGGGGVSATEKNNWIKYLKKENRALLVESIVDFVVKHKLDGIDLDLEGNILPNILNDYRGFVKHLKNDLHAIGKAITVALPAQTDHNIGFDIIKEFDFINIMCYGRGDNQLYSNAEKAISFWTKYGGTGIAKGKLVLGVPFFGWTLESTPKAYTFQSEVIKDINNAYNDRPLLNNHNSIPTIMKKTLLAKEKINGIMIWEIGQDSFGDLSLLKTIDETLKASANCSNPTIFFKDMDNDGFGDINNPFISCEVPDSYVENSNDCDDNDPLIGICN